MSSTTPELAPLALAPGQRTGGGMGRRAGKAKPARLVPRHSLATHVEAMRSRGMSATAIRRALGLSEQAAVEAGIVGGAQAEPAPPSAPRRGRQAEASANGRTPNDGAPGLTPGRLPMAQVLAAVASASGVSGAEIVGASQSRRLTPLRQITMYLLRELCVGASLPAIGHFLGRDHTTIHYGCRMAATRLAGDPTLRRLCDTVRSQCLSHGAGRNGPA